MNEFDKTWASEATTFTNEPERERLDAVAGNLREQVEKLQTLLVSLRDRLRPVLVEEEDVPCDVLRAVHPRSSPLTSHLAETAQSIGEAQGRVSDLIRRLDIGA